MSRYYTYLDNAATTCCLSETREKIYNSDAWMYGNPGGIHEMSVTANSAISSARGKVAELMGCFPDNIIFTSGGTESNNTAIIGAAEHLIKVDKTHIIISAGEHDSIVKSVEHLISVNNKFSMTIVPLMRDGKIDMQELFDSVKDNTGMIAVMHSNNETGAVNQHLDDIGKVCTDKGILFHVDCVQSAGFIPINVEKFMCTSASISGHKFHGPKGIGALYLKNKSTITPLIHGGSNQEFGLRGGTENLPAIIGMGDACKIALEYMSDNILGFSNIKNVLYNELMKGIAKINSERLLNDDIPILASINGPQPDEAQDRNNWGTKVMSLTIRGVDNETLVLMLSNMGVIVSAGSACRSREVHPSRTLISMGLSNEESRNTIRISFSRFTTEDEVVYTAKKIVTCVDAILNNRLLRRN